MHLSPVLFSGLLVFLTVPTDIQSADLLDLPLQSVTYSLLGGIQSPLKGRKNPSVYNAETDDDDDDDSGSSSEEDVIIETYAGDSIFNPHDISRYNAYLDKGIQRVQAILKKTDIPAPPRIKPFTFKIGNLTLNGYLGARNGQIKVNTINRLGDVGVEVRDDSTFISLGFTLKNIYINYKTVYLSFLDSYVDGSLKLYIPTFYYSAEFKLGQHTATCADISLLKVKIKILNPKVTVYGFPCGNYYVSNWVKNTFPRAIDEITSELETLELSFGNSILEKFHCK